MTLEKSAAASTSRVAQPLRAAAILSVLYFLARLTGLFQLQIINANLPRHATAAYAASFGLTDFLNYLVAGGALSMTFIPLFTKLRETGREGEAWEFFSALATLMTFVVGGLILVAWVFVGPLTDVFSPVSKKPVYHGLSTFDFTVQMTAVILPAQLFFYLGGSLNGVLNANKRFGVSGLTGAAYNVVAIIVAVVWWKLTGDPVAFAWGIFVGAFFGVFCMPLVATLTGPLESRLRFRPSFRWNTPHLREYFRVALPIMIGVSFPVMDQVVVKRFAAGLPQEVSEQVLTCLQTGNRMMLVPLAMVAQAASVAAFPYFASDSAAQDWRKLADFLRQGLRRLMFLTLPLSMLLILLAKPLVSLVFGYGEYNKGTAINDTAVAFAFYCVGLFAWAGQQLVARGFYALQDTKTPTIIGSVIMVVFFVPLLWLCTKITPGVLPFALATSVGACVHFGAMLIAFERKLAASPYAVALHAERVCGTLLRTASACVVMGVVGVLAMRLLNFLPVQGKTGDLCRVFLVTAAALPAFGLACRAFQIPEAAWLWKRLAGRFIR